MDGVILGDEGDLPDGPGLSEWSHGGEEEGVEGDEGLHGA